MEFNEKLQELRKNRRLTQEQLAGALFVSRTAVSKWESGRGYPSIDSLKAIAKFFEVSVDELLSESALAAHKKQSYCQQNGVVRNKTFALVDLSALLLLFLPVFGQKSAGGAKAVSLLRLYGVAPYLRIAYIAVVACMAVMGILLLFLRNSGKKRWKKQGAKISLALTAAGIVLFVLGRQPYASLWLLAYLVIKLRILAKRQCYQSYHGCDRPFLAKTSSLL